MLAQAAVILNVAVPVAYAAAVSAYLVLFIRGVGRPRMPRVLLGLALAVHLALVVVRWVGTGQIPLSSTYEGVTFFTLSVTLVYAYLEMRVGLQTVGVFVLGIALVFQTIASVFLYVPFRSLPEQLNSHWFAIHSGSTTLSFSAFAIGAALSTLYLRLYRELHAARPGFFFRRIPSLETLDEMSYRGISLGFVLLTTGILTGMVWANEVWGRPWSWDPKQCSALTTWLAFGAYLWLRARNRWRGKRNAIFAIGGFVILVFTFFVVEFIFRTAHRFG